jgi:hypothetical protein
MRLNLLRGSSIKVRFRLFLAMFGLALMLALAAPLLLRDGDRAPQASSTGSSLSETASVGINLSGISDWSTQIPFLDVFRASRRWVPQCSSQDPGCDDSWGTEEDDLLDLDEHGWVKSLPAPEDPPIYTRVGTLMLRDLGRYPGGKYVVLYEGEGTIEYKFDARKNVAESAPGRDVIDVTPSNAGIYLLITATDPNKTGNYIRNIHVVPASDEANYESRIFNPTFLERIRAFKSIRFMGWMETNDSTQREWNQRPDLETASYSSPGVPVETMVALVNQLAIEPWFNMPHMATDEYITRFAEYVRDYLNPELKVYVEYSNEVWNPQFEQFHWVLEQSRQEWGQESPYQWYGKRTAETCDIWKRTFGEANDRVICVMGTQSSVPDRGEQALTCRLWSEAPCYKHGIDVFAITGYFGGYFGKPEHEQEVQSWLSEPDGGFSKFFTDLKENAFLNEGGLQSTFDRMQRNQELARRYGLGLVAYEGGQHVIGIQQVRNNEAIVNFFAEANRHPEMYDIYTRLLNEWQRLGGGLFMHFTDIGRPSRSGSWGALEHVEDTGSPKYDALMDFIDRHPG